MTILGHATADELRAFVAAKDYENSAMLAAWQALAPAAQQSADGASWLADWNAYTTRYANARAGAETALALADASGIAESSFPVQDPWDWMLCAEKVPPTLFGQLAKRPSNSAYQKGDKQDLANRLTVLRGGAPIDFSGEPQPPKRDLDLSAFIAADKTIKQIESLERTSLAWAPWLIGGAALAWALTVLPRKR